MKTGLAVADAGEAEPATLAQVRLRGPARQLVRRHPLCGALDQPVGNITMEHNLRVG